MEASQDEFSLVCLDFSLKSIDEWTKLFYIAIDVP